MKQLPYLILAMFCGFTSLAVAVTLEELNQRYKPLPTVPEKDLPPLKNQPESFPGVIEHSGLKGHTWVRFPFVENPGSFGFDFKGRLFVVEANRFWQGVPDLRGANELIRGDFQAKTVEDRAKLYQTFAGRFPPTFFTNTADRIIRLEDRDGNGAADHRTLFSNHFKQPLDGIGFSVLAEGENVYFTCIPNLWKLTDNDDDGVADNHEVIVKGFGVRVSFIGHDLHGIIRGPDGRLYFSVGDRGYHVTTEDGKVHAGSGRGAIFRCESDGSGFEVFCNGLRNPQELAFDEYGNLFTFDNTGDIGDVARMVYALEGSDSGWDMSHQSPHHYRTILDWGDFHPETSAWVSEKMFETHNLDQPQWVYPPASHVARGPSGVTYLTGESLPEDLRGKFLLANYRGPSENCTILTVGVEPKGAGYTAVSEDVLVKGVGVSDVELGYDGNIYICDFGGGWSINTNGAIQVLTSTDEAQQIAGKKIASQFKQGFASESIGKLVAWIRECPDRRLRQEAQFELVKRGNTGRKALANLATDNSVKVTSRLHGIWGLGQIARLAKYQDLSIGKELLELTKDSETEVRANAARELGSIRFIPAADRLIDLLEDESTRVQSIAAIALGRVARPGNEKAIEGLYQLAETTEHDPVLRHACLSGLDQIGTVASAVNQSESSTPEVRLMSLLFLRRKESPELARFLYDGEPVIRREAIRAIYDTAALDGPAGEMLGAMAPTEIVQYPPMIQRRIVAANYRLGGDENARQLVELASEDALPKVTREAALHGLRMWAATIDTDPVLGHYRPVIEKDRSMTGLGTSIETELRSLLGSDLPPSLAALALKLANESGVKIEEKTLSSLARNAKIEAEVRVAALDSLVDAAGENARGLVEELLKDSSAKVAAAALKHGFGLGVNEVSSIGRKSILFGPLDVARAGIVGLAKSDPSTILNLWKEREGPQVRPELYLDLYLALQSSSDSRLNEAATKFASSAPFAVHHLSETGGDRSRGESVFRNQGACLQCHKVGGDGGIQGPALTQVGDRLKPDKVVESLVNPNAEIAKGYGLSSVSLKDGNALAGRIASQNRKVVKLIAMDGKETEIPAENIASITPPMSAMPPLGASLPPRDLRDLVAYLNSLKSGKSKVKDDASHGDSDEKIAK